MKRVNSAQGESKNLFWKLCGAARTSCSQQVVLESFSGRLLYDLASMATRMSEYWNHNAHLFGRNNNAGNELSAH